MGRILLIGALVGVVGALLLTFVGWLAYGLEGAGRVSLVGVPVGLLLLLVGLGCSLVAYRLAQQGKNGPLRGRLLTAAATLAAAGMACGLTSTLAWVLTGRPTLG